jgi:FkbM family methyltransferase
MIFWDIGAHIGFMSFIAARIVGPRGQVHAFEALPSNVARLKRAVQLNGFSNVTVHNLAVAASSGIRRFFPHGSSLMGSLTRENGGEAISVQSRTMDELSASLGSPGLVKIDVEGAEVEILEGGKNILATGVPLIIEISEQFERCRSLLPGYKLEHLAKIDWLCLR